MTVKTRDAEENVLQDESPTATTEPAPEPEEEGAVKTNKMVIIAESGDLEKTWATTILASTAAASGMEVSIFFTFWGFMALVKPEKRTFGDNWMQKMMSVMNRPGIDHRLLQAVRLRGVGPAEQHEAVRISDG